MTLYCCALHDTEVAALRIIAADEGCTVVDLADCDQLPNELVAGDRIAVLLGSVVTLLGCLRQRRYFRGLDVLVIAPAGVVPPVACEPIDGIAVTYIADDELQRLPA